MKLAFPAFAVVALGLLLGGCAPKQPDAAAVPAGGGPEAVVLQQKLVGMIPNLKAENIRPSAAAGIYEVQDGANYGYVTADGRYLIAGDLVDLQTGQSLTENRRKAERVAKLKELGEDKMIVFAPASGTKHTVTVFTDVDCGYCRKLHSEIERYNAQGIAVRYLAYPRSGPQTESFRKAEVVWCATDRKAALTEAKNGAPLTGGNAGCANPVAQEWALGNDFGLRGTPLIVLEDGSLINGYVPAEVLAQRLAAPSPSAAALNGAPQG